MLVCCLLFVRRRNWVNVMRAYDSLARSFARWLSSVRFYYIKSWPCTTNFIILRMNTRRHTRMCVSLSYIRATNNKYTNNKLERGKKAYTHFRHAQPHLLIHIYPIYNWNEEQKKLQQQQQYSYSYTNSFYISRTDVFSNITLNVILSWPFSIWVNI